ncbi:MAG: lantibiotic dehydratase [Bacteroidota bacterium]
MRYKTLEYSVWDTFMIRSPYLSLEFFDKLHKRGSDLGFFKRVFSDIYLLNALYLASPEFYQAMMNFLEEGRSSKERDQRIIHTINKYLNRISTRATPFGLFAGIGLGTFNSQDSFIKKDFIQSYPKINQELLDAISICPEFVLNEDHFKYYFNEAHYISDGELRFYGPLREGRFYLYQLESIEMDEVIQEIMQLSRNGIELSGIVQAVKGMGYSLDESESFILSLIENYLLIPVLKPYSPKDTAPDNNDMIQLLKNISGHWEPKTLRSIERMQSFMGSIKRRGYDQISSCPLHITSVESYEVSNLDNKIKQYLRDTIHVLDYVGRHKINEDYQEFTNTYKTWYGEKEVRLVDCMDLEYGIGYPVFTHRTDNEFLSGFNWEKKKVEAEGFPKYDKREHHLLELMKKTETSKDPLIITEDFLSKLKSNPFPYQPMFEGLFEIYEIENKVFVHPISVGGSSGYSMKSRFSEFDDQIKAHLKKVHTKEQNLRNNELMVDVSFVPFGAPGNLVDSTNASRLELKFVRGNSSGGTSVSLDDIYLKSENDKLILFSKIHKRAIMPCFRNSLDYALLNVPILRFLYDHQFKGNLSENYFTWGKVGHDTNFLPRVSYKNVLLHKATWRIEVSSLKEMIYCLEDATRFEDLTRAWVMEMGFPKYVQLVERDNKLLIDTENQNSLKFLIFTVRNLNSIELSEFLFNKRSLIVDQQNEHYVNEFVFCFQRNNGTD